MSLRKYLRYNSIKVDGFTSVFLCSSGRWPSREQKREDRMSYKEIQLNFCKWIDCIWFTQTWTWFQIIKALACCTALGYPQQGVLWEAQSTRAYFVIHFVFLPAHTRVNRSLMLLKDLLPGLFVLQHTTVTALWGHEGTSEAPAVRFMSGSHC